MTNNPKYIVIHCSDVSYRQQPDQFSSINAYHRDVKGFSRSSLGLYVGYQVLVTGGKTYRCRADSDEGSHCNQGFDGATVYQPGPEGSPHLGWPSGVLSMNFQSLGVCAGFAGDVEMPTPDQYALLQKQVWAWQDEYGITDDRVFFHRKFNVAKTCPGSLVTAQWLADLLRRPLPTDAKPAQFTCDGKDATIVAQGRQIRNLQDLVQSLLAWWSSKKG